jgi:hypothetical protein
MGAPFLTKRQNRHQTALDAAPLPNTCPKSIAAVVRHLAKPVILPVILHVRNGPSRGADRNLPAAFALTQARSPD